MILTKGHDGVIPYILPGSSSPPTAISRTVRDPAGKMLSTESISPPASYAVTGQAGDALDEGVLTALVAPTGLQPGQILRVVDTGGRWHDALLYGVSAKVLRVADLGCAAEDAVSVWCPEIEISVPGTILSDTGEGWRADLSWTAGGRTRRDTIFFTVCVLSLSLDISPREYLDAHPEAASDLAALERRRDWPRLVRTASQMVEERLRAVDRWYAAIISTTGLRRAVIEALAVILGPSSIPQAYSVSPSEWLSRLDARFSAAVADCTARVYYDADQSGTADEDEQTAPAGVAYRVL